MANDPVLSLSLTDNATLEYVLSDIPFFCVGLTALAVFSFMIVMRRIDMRAISLYSSSLIAFVAAIFDLAQILSRGTTNTDQGLALNTFGLALSFGFRYLYLWAYVAQQLRMTPLFSETHYHSARWERWGLPGLILKFALLGAVFSIPILQIVWRIAIPSFSTVYVAESTIQIAVSVLLIAKLMLNLFLSTVAPWWRPFTPYIVPIIALMISTGIGTGNLLLFKFSETTLGRFLQAVEIYALMLSLLIFTFYNVPKFDPDNHAISQRKARSSFFGGLQDFKAEEPAFRVQVSAAPSLDLPSVLQIGPGDASPSDRGSRESRISRMSSWINVRRAPRPNSGEQKLWNSGDAELGISTQVRTGTPEPSIAASTPRVQVFEEKRPVQALNAIERREPIPPTPTALEVPSTPSTARPFTGVSFASSTLSVRQDLAERESVNSFDELLRQQTELDKSIAALRLFSPTTAATMPVPPEPEPESEFKLGDRTVSMSSGTNRSEFSLSIFPEPPPVDPLPETILPLGGRARDAPFPGVRQSEGTQYDVTSFIGDLTTPGPASEQKISVLGEVAEKPEVESDAESPVITTAASTVSLRPLYLSSMLPAITSLPPAMASSGVLPSSSQTNYEYPVLKPLLLGGVAPSVPSPLSAGARRTPGTSISGPRRPTVRIGQGRPTISGPRPQEGEQADEAEAFEKPRRPPALTLQDSQ
ncbi:hypothetical protein B0H16DRAFT_1490925 [Mycena metata]|uniref:Uncharacterized protein n=1 Tax=Mycena metata TaxID=1033252 RepID=A0AAD7KIT1_9AGAR|nr:hypothetical protein B0H16DRAFT_1490925 [Mycena metata]